MNAAKEKIVRGEAAAPRTTGTTMIAMTTAIITSANDATVMMMRVTTTAAIDLERKRDGDVANAFRAQAPDISSMQRLLTLC